MKRNILLVAILAITLAGCDFLNVVPDNVATLDNAFEDKAQAEKYLYTCYSYLPMYMDPTKDPAIMGSGEFLSYTSGNGAISLYNMGLITGGQNVTTPICNNWESDSWYDSPYDGIRVCNTFLEKIDEAYDLDIITKNRWISEVKFLKAYFNFLLIRMYGPIILNDVNSAVDASPEMVRKFRSPLDECVDYVAALLDEAEAGLPLRIEKETEELGRATKPIAAAVKAKLLVLAASPLFNGNPSYAGITDKNGTHLFPKAGEDPQKWVRAKEAVKHAIDIAHSAGHELYTLGANAYSLNDELQEQLQIRNKIWSSWNKETVWGYTRTNTFWLQANCMPRLTSDALKSSYVKGGALAPTQAVAELFYTENGVPMDEDKSFDYAGRYSTRAASEAEKWKVSTKVDAASGQPFVTAKVNFGREPRFYASLGFDGALWWGNGKTNLSSYNELYTIAAKFSQLQGETWASLYSVTGYFAKKLIDPETTFSTSSFSTKPAPFPMIRMSDLYLLYAECSNEIDGPNDEAYNYVDSIRVKAGLKGVVDSWRDNSTQPAKPETKSGLREIIHRERMIELAMEGQTMWDIRRWLEGTKWWNGQVYTWNITEKQPEAYYNQVVLLSAAQKFTQRDYLWPISQNQMSINPNLVQNFGW